MERVGQILLVPNGVNAGSTTWSFFMHFGGGSQLPSISNPDELSFRFLIGWESHIAWLNGENIKSLFLIHTRLIRCGSYSRRSTQFPTGTWSDELSWTCWFYLFIYLFLIERLVKLLRARLAGFFSWRFRRSWTSNVSAAETLQVTTIWRKIYTSTFLF